MVDRIEDWPWRSYLAFIGRTKSDDGLTTDWILSQFGDTKRFAKEHFQDFVLEGIDREFDIGSGLKGQIYLGDESFVSKRQSKIKKSTDDWSIPKKQQRPIAQPMFEFTKQYKERNSAIVAAYATGAYSQREIAEYFELHPSTVGVIVKQYRNSSFGT